MEKFKVGEKLIAYDSAYWGPKYNNTDVTVVSVQHPMYTVQCFDNICRSVSYEKLITMDDFYNMQDQCNGRASYEVDNSPPPLPKCNCDITLLMRYGCKCGGE